MSRIDNIYGVPVKDDAENKIYQIINLCKVGVAASDTTVAIDCGKGGFDSLFEVIAALADDAIGHIEKAEYAARKTAK